MSIRSITCAALCLLPLTAPAALVTLDLQPLHRVDAQGPAQRVMLDIAAAATQAVGGPWVLRSARLHLSFIDDDDPLHDLGLLGYDGQSDNLSARRETRDGINGIVTYRRITEYQARGFENAVERAVIRAEGLAGEAQSASRQIVLGETTPVLQAASWSGWTCYAWGCAGTETQRYSAERWRGTVYDGVFEHSDVLGAQALAAMQRDGHWWLEVGASAGDFLWRRLRLDLEVERGPDAVVSAPPASALALLGLVGIAAVRHRRRAPCRSSPHPRMAAPPWRTRRGPRPGAGPALPAHGHGRATGR